MEREILAEVSFVSYYGEEILPFRIQDFKRSSAGIGLIRSGKTGRKAGMGTAER
jgi:hypothetical protein